MQSQSAKPFDSIRIAQISDEGMTGASVSTVLKEPISTVLEMDYFAQEPERRAVLTTKARSLRNLFCNFVTSCLRG
jgi:hypothetical protein